MILKTFVEPPIDNNNYLLIDENTKDAVLIDCSARDENIYAAIKEADAKLKYILLTHGHFDHIAGIRNNPDVKVVMHKDDLGWLKKANQYLPMFGMPEITIPNIDIFVNDGDVIKFGTLEIKVLHTPGHTPGGVCYYVNGMLFSGDTLFRGSVGRCDLDGGDFKKIVSSIEDKIFVLPKETVVYPGHGKITSVGWEKENNGYV